MKKNVIIILALIGIGLVLGTASFFLKTANPTAANTKRTLITINNQTFEVAVADTPSKRLRGLSGREALQKNEGMLFLFDRAGRYGFWMKDMRFPIDIIWIRGTRVVGFSENLQAEPHRTIFTLPLYYPPEAADKVLELNAGLVKRYGFKGGDEVTIFSP